MRDVVSYTDYFVICSGRNRAPDAGDAAEMPRGAQARPACSPAGSTASAQGDWILLDFLDVVVHVFTPEARGFYRLESLWGEVPSESYARVPEPRLHPGRGAGAAGRGDPRLAERMVALRAEMEPLRRRWQQIVIAIGSNGGGLDKRDAERCARRSSRLSTRWSDDPPRSDRTACRSRIIDRGLLDFPTVIDGEPALLCWQVGSSGSSSGTRSRTGFAGRRPL